MTDLKINQDYQKLLAEIKQKITTRQTQALMAVNQQLLRLYWEIGHLILLRQEKANW